MLMFMVWAILGFGLILVAVDCWVELPFWLLRDYLWGNAPLATRGHRLAGWMLHKDLSIRLRLGKLPFVNISYRWLEAGVDIGRPNSGRYRLTLMIAKQLKKV